VAAGSVRQGKRPEDGGRERATTTKEEGRRRGKPEDALGPLPAHPPLLHPGRGGNQKFEKREPGDREKKEKLASVPRNGEKRRHYLLFPGKEKEKTSRCTTAHPTWREPVREERTFQRSRGKEYGPCLEGKKGGSKPTQAKGPSTAPDSAGKSASTPCPAGGGRVRVEVEGKEKGERPPRVIDRLDRKGLLSWEREDSFRGKGGRSCERVQFIFKGDR